jgi:hypothetical protein
MIDNTPKWIEVDVQGETTKTPYFGRFLVKPFLTHGERADAQRLADRYTVGMEEGDLKNLMRMISFLSLHIQDNQAPWWAERGLNLVDEAPLYEIAKKLDELRNPAKPEEPS